MKHIAVGVLLLAAAWAPFVEAVINLSNVARDARSTGTNSLQEIREGEFSGYAMRIFVGFQQYRDSSSECQRAAMAMLKGCARQYTWLTNHFGKLGIGNLFPPDFSADMLTPDVLAQVPRPSRRCCRHARTFQDNFCACDRNIILAFRNFGWFDAYQSIPFANHVYGHQCGGRTYLADECPNGNPFAADGRRLLRSA